MPETKAVGKWPSDVPSDRHARMLACMDDATRTRHERWSGKASRASQWAVLPGVHSRMTPVSGAPFQNA